MLNKHNQKTDSPKEKKQKIIVFFILIVGSVFIILNTIQTLYISNTVNSETKNDYEQSVEQIANTTATTLSNEIGGYIREMRMYTETNTALSGDIPAMVEWIKQRSKNRSNDFDYIIVCGPDGIYYTDSGVSGNIKERDYFKAIFDEKKPFYVDNPVISKTTGKGVIHITRAVLKDGIPIALFAGNISIERIQQKIQAITLGEHGYAWMLDGDGIVISHPNEEFVMKKNFITDEDIGYEDLSEITKAAIKRETGYKWITGLKGGKDLVCYNPIDYTPWTLVFSVESQQVMATGASLQKIMIATSIIVYIIILLLIGVITSIILKPLRIVETTIHNIASGSADLTQRIKIHSNNEIGSVVNGFNKFTEKLQNIISDIKNSNVVLTQAGEDMKASTQDTASAITQIQANIESVHNQIVNQSASVEETAGAVNEIASNIASLERMIETQSSGVVQASAAVEEMIGNINSVDQVVSKMSDSFEELLKKSETGASKQNDVNERIEEIKQKSETLGEANKSIENIAAQTNLLAMNAAIEAAHAGDAGKGFSVVADEIRKLSETSTQQSKTIGEQLKNIQESIDSVVGASAESSEAFNTVSNKIRQTDELVRQIKGAMQEQKEGSTQITQALHSMNDSTAEVKTASAEMNEGNKAILAEIKSLQDITVTLKESTNEMQVGANKVYETGSVLTEISNKVDKSISSIGSQIDQFIV